MDNWIELPAEYDVSDNRSWLLFVNGEVVIGSSKHNVFYVNGVVVRPTHYKPAPRPPLSKLENKLQKYMSDWISEADAEHHTDAVLTIIKSHRDEILELLD